MTKEKELHGPGIKGQRAADNSYVPGPDERLMPKIRSEYTSGRHEVTKEIKDKLLALLRIHKAHF